MVHMRTKKKLWRVDFASNLSWENLHNKVFIFQVTGVPLQPLIVLFGSCIKIELTKGYSDKE